LRRHRLKDFHVRFVSILFASVFGLFPWEYADAAPPLLLRAQASERAANAPGLNTQASAVRFNAGQMLALRHLEEAEVTLPDGVTHPLVVELVQPHGNGIFSWVGSHRDAGNAYRAIVTTGPGGSFGVIDVPGGHFRIVPGEGHDWLIDMDREERFLPPIDLGHDFRFPPEDKAQAEGTLAEPEVFVPMEGETSLPISKAAPAPAYVVDIMFVVTQTLSARLGANLMTRLNFLVTRANTAYVDSEVAITLRLATTVAVDYPDTGSDATALNAITPVNGGGTGAFANVEAVRSLYGADVVSFLRNGQDYGGSGSGWVGTPPSANYMYSVVTGCVMGCESVFIHEVGHNMGNMHDRATTAWQDGGTSIYDQGAYPYSYGHVFCASGVLSCNPYVPSSSGGCVSQPECSLSSGNNFRTLMSYFQNTASTIYKFSNPNITCGPEARPCGISETASNSAYNALSMNNTRAIVSGLKASAPSISLVSVKSRKTHAAMGTYDIAIDKSQALTGNVSVEPRAIGSGHRVVFQFGANVTSTGGATTTLGTVGNVAINGTEVQVTVTGIPDNRRATVTLRNVSGSGLDFSASAGFLVGDENSTRSVNSTDITLVKSHAGETVASANAAFDVNLSGAVTAADILAAKGRSGLSIP
jgi:hypothetical protein